ncbi:MAG: hypothetical protein E7313_02380 [Clostridiales bacterium]|nr:hypothetical protein [Clostridiales bacterium]
MKVFFKKLLLIILLVCILVPSLFSGFALAAEDNVDMVLTKERAGNYAANFAINFYENWSSINYVGGSSENSGSGKVSGEYMWPLENYNVTSEFNEDRGDGNHKGMDLDADMGTPIYASNGGVIEYLYNGCLYNVKKGMNEDCPDCANCWNYGNHIKISHTDQSGTVVQTLYAHCTNIEENLKIGDTVSKGQLIGTVGTTGQSTGPHLHFEFIVNGEYVDPHDYIKEAGKPSGVNASSKSKTRGEIATEYDENATLENIVEGTKPYKFSNTSWINFVYKYALSMDGNIIVGTNVNSNYFDDSKKIMEEKIEKYEDTDVIDIAKLINEGRILPGDILYIHNGIDAGQYVLYVGGTKIIYATPPIESTVGSDSETEENEKQSALKYEYIEYYMRRIENNLKEIQAGTTTETATGDKEESSEGTKTETTEEVIPKYGVTEIYRINNETVANIKESNTNLIFASKGYYSDISYAGIPTEITKNISTKVSLFSSIKQLLKFFINLIIYMVKMQVIGWINIAEVILQEVLLGISGHGASNVIDAFFGSSATSASGNRITVEAIFFNQIPILDANFFNLESAGGRSLVLKEIEIAGPLMPGEERETGKVYDEGNIVYQLRKNLAFWYVLLRNVSIALLLVVLLYIGIRMAITSSSEQKATYKQALMGWITGFIVVIFIHLFMVFVMEVNNTAISLLKNMEQGFANDAIAEDIEQQESLEQRELNMYDAIRYKAYDFDFEVSVPAIILYVTLVYLLIRFTLVYLKRYITIYFLALSGSLIGVKYALARAAGKKTDSLAKWFKDFSFNVLLQTVHAFIYILFMAVAISIAETSLIGLAICLVILNTMLKADKIIIKIFGLDKAGSLADVNQFQPWKSVYSKFIPIYTISKSIASHGNKWLFGKRGLITEYRYLKLDVRTYKDAEKKLDDIKFRNMGKRWEIINRIMKARGISKVVDLANKTPLRKLGEINRYKMLLGTKNISSDTRKMLYKHIQGTKKLKKAKFTRKVQMVTDLALGHAGKIAALGMFIDEPEAAMGLYVKSNSRIKKYTTKNKYTIKNSIYGGSKASAESKYINSKNAYEAALDLYTENQYNYEQKKSKLERKISSAASELEKNRFIAELDVLNSDRVPEKSKEMHSIQEAYEKFIEDKISYGNAKFENRTFNKARGVIEKVTGIDTLNDVVANDVKASFKAKDSYGKSLSAFSAYENIISLEQELREINKELKAEQQRKLESLATDAERESLLKEYDKQYRKVIKETRNHNISNRSIQDSIEEYMYNNHVDKISEYDIDGVLTILENKLAEIPSKDIKFSSETRDKIKNLMKDKMIKDNKALGYDTKDTMTTLRSVLGKDGVLEPKDIMNASTKDDRIENLYKQMIQKVKDINTYNEVGKVKYKKGTLININKILKDLNK